MQSGTILHLALLKKLSSRSRKLNYAQKFASFRDRNNQTSTTKHRPSCYSAELFVKYSEQQEGKSITCKSSKSSRSSKPRQPHKPPYKLQKTYQNLCGWSIGNQQSFDYMLKLKQSTTLPKQTPSQRQKRKHRSKFTFCEEEPTKGIFLSNHLSRFQEFKRNPQIKHLLITQTFTEPQPKTSKSNLLSGEAALLNDKENLFSIQTPHPVSYRSQIRCKSKQLSRIKKPLVQLKMTTFKHPI